MTEKPAVDNPYQYDDEIDLFELLQTLWNGKIVLLIFLVLGAALSVAYAFTARQQWTSVAYLSEPQLAQISGYLDHRRALARANGDKPVDVAALESSLFSAFISQATTKENQLDYLKGSDYYKNLVQSGSIADDAISRQTLLDNLVNQNLKIDQSDKKSIAQYFSLSFSADTAQQAQQILRGYVDFINSRAFKFVDTSFNNGLDATVAAKKTALSNIEFKLQAERQYTIKTLTAALETAKLAGVTDYTVARQTDKATVIELANNNRLFMLGQKYLNAELKTAEDTPIVPPPRVLHHQA